MTVPLSVWVEIVVYFVVGVLAVFYVNNFFRRSYVYTRWLFKRDAPSQSDAQSYEEFRQSSKIFRVLIWLVRIIGVLLVLRSVLIILALLLAR